MFRHFLFSAQIICLFFIAASAYAENPLPVPAPFESKYERFQQSRNAQSEEEIFGSEDQTGDERGAARNPVKSQKTKAIIIEIPEKEFSALEILYSKRAGEKLAQFGYDLFGIPEPETQEQLDRMAQNDQDDPLPMGAVQDDFLLHAGDELDITFTGQRMDHGLYKINSQGLITIPDLPPIPAEGRTIGQVRLSIQAAAQNLHNTQAYVSLSSVRQINVLVMGHVKRPGRQTLTVFHTVIDALMAAGGADKTGSLRQIKLVRGGVTTKIDLYNLLSRGKADTDLRLRDGDRILIPPIGPTVAIAGEIKRPGIYEIPDNEKLNLAEMLDLAGGVLVPGRNRFLNLEVTRSGHEKVTSIDDAVTPIFGDGSILMVSKGEEKRAGTVEVTGHVLRPGLFALGENPALSALFTSSDILKSDAYPLLGIIERQDKHDLARKLIAFPLRQTVMGEYDAPLQDGDKIRIFSVLEILELAKAAPPETEMHQWTEDDPTSIDPALASFLHERSAFVRGAIRNPGAYPVAEGVTLDSLLAAAGGLTLEADPANIEISSVMQDSQNGTRRRKVREEDAPSLLIRSGDAIRIGQKFRRVEDKSVLILGEVKNPGRYDLLPGDRLSDLLRRSGGLTQEAYPDGTIFSRESERRAEEARFRAQAREMQRAIAATLEQNKDKISADQLAEARALALELEEAEGVGRIIVEADPYILQEEPELDMLLEGGDRIYVPAKSLTVRVSGEILSPATLQFRKNKEAMDYIDEAGGFTYNADKERSFILYPDGSAQPLEVSSWGYSDDLFIPPGSTIIVPRDPKPFSFIESARDISQILSNLAITALFVDDVRDSN